MTIQEATNQQEWDEFLKAQQYSPFLQSWTMGEVYRDVGEEPVRLEAREGNDLVGICQAVVVPAKRGKHLAIAYGPVLRGQGSGVRGQTLDALFKDLKTIAREHHCSFIRVSPFWPTSTPSPSGTKPSPLHLLAEHIWCIDLQNKTEEEILKNMRQNHRNLIRRAQREGVSVTASANPNEEIEEFFRLYEETRKRHHFVPYPAEFIRSQVRHFSAQNACTLYLARYNNEVIASSVHMHFGGETSYHHGASTHKYPKIPASYLLQWTAITDALKRGDHLYNFWGIAPEGVKKHPFRGVTTFKTGFGGELMELMHCFDVPLKPPYYATRAFELWRKWKRGF
ncbi:MAG: peptidoglycan bridge formation glycyltransferase FemA/FemB family protein [Candidatus Peribacteraceae bacterium]